MAKTNLKDPTIVLIGGAAGTGKTTIANKLCTELSISHRLGSGFIREIARSFVPKKEAPALYTYSFRPTEKISPFENLCRQSAVIKKAVEACIRRAYDEGTSIVIEGVNIIPGLINPGLTTLFAVLSVNDPKMHKEMICGQTHLKRRISETDFTAVREIQDDFIKVSGENGVPVVDITDIDDTTKRMIKMINDR